jgi:hypothetical protein
MVWRGRDLVAAMSERTDGVRVESANGNVRIVCTAGGKVANLVVTKAYARELALQLINVSGGDDGTMTLESAQRLAKAVVGRL